MKQIKNRYANFRWNLYDNNGSYKGWFDWLPLWMRVGYWSPITVIFLFCFYSSMIIFKPKSLQFDIPSSGFDTFSFVGDCIVSTWGLSLLLYTIVSKDTYAGFYISFTGWSWMVLTLRATLNILSHCFLYVAASSSPSIFFTSCLSNASYTLAICSSALQLPTIVQAFITTTLWNVIFFPLIYFIAIPKHKMKERAGFLKFNFSFFMNNIHICNLPLACINTIYDYGSNNVRLFTNSDLYVGYVIVALYSMVYLFVLDRIGLHFYPIFCPRTSLCCVSFTIILGLYYVLMTKANEIIALINSN